MSGKPRALWIAGFVALSAIIALWQYEQRAGPEGRRGKGDRQVISGGVSVDEDGGEPAASDYGGDDDVSTDTRPQRVVWRVVLPGSVAPVPRVTVRGRRESGVFLLPENDRGQPVVEGRNLEAWAQRPLVVRAPGIRELRVPYSYWDGRSPELTVEVVPDGRTVRIAGIVESEAGGPLANAVVLLHSPPLVVRTDANGRFAIVLPGAAARYPVLLRVWASGHFAWTGKLGEGDDTEFLQVVLNANTLQVENLTLRIRTSNGETAPGHVELLPGLDGPRTGEQLGAATQAALVVKMVTGFDATTGSHALDPNGELRMPLIAKGKCRVRAVAGAEVVDTVVDIKDSHQTIELRARPGVAVRTRVDLDSVAGGQGAIQAHVEQFNGGRGWPPPTLEWSKGDVLLISGLPFWRHTLVLEAETGAPVRIPVEADVLEPGRPSVVPPVSFYPRRTVTGVALDLSGERIQRGRITVRTKEGDYSRAWIREGRFEIEIAGTQVKFVGLRDSESRSTRTGISLTPITSREWRVRMRKAPVDLAEEEPNK